MAKDLEDYDQIDEARIRERAVETNSKNLRRLLKIGEEWREAGCTPVYIIAQEEPMVIACVAEETFGRPYN